MPSLKSFSFSYITACVHIKIMNYSSPMYYKCRLCICKYDLLYCFWRNFCHYSLLFVYNHQNGKDKKLSFSLGILFVLSKFIQRARSCFFNFQWNWLTNRYYFESENEKYVILFSLFPALGIAFIIFDQAEKMHERMSHKNPADFENDQ